MVVAIGENQQDFQNCLARVLRLTPGQITALTEDDFAKYIFFGSIEKPANAHRLLNDTMHH